MTKRGTFFFLTMIWAGMVVPAAYAIDADISTTITTAPNTADYEELVDFQVTYGNLGPDATTRSFLDFYFPAGAFLGDDLWTLNWEISDDNVIAGIYLAPSCDRLTVQMQGPGDPDDRPIPMDLPVGHSGTLDLHFTMPMEDPVKGVVRVDTPGNLAGLLDIGYATCLTCDDLSTCFGTPIFQADPPASGEFLVVDDGVDPATDGCTPIQNDLTGSIALVRRGTCEFSLKAYNAQQAGAAAVVVMNDREQDISTFGMGIGDFGALVTIPVSIIDQADGDALEASIMGGVPVTGIVGAITSNVVVFDSRVFHASTDGEPDDTDPDSSNNADSHMTVLGPEFVFWSGFEFGTLNGWILYEGGI